MCGLAGASCHGPGKKDANMKDVSESLAPAQGFYKEAMEIF